MECPNCKTIYNDNNHIPRLLIQCGHSLCDKCTYLLFSNHSVICPECNTPNFAATIEAFPRNLALLLINKSHLNKAPNSFERINTRQNMDQNNDSMKQTVFFCTKHHKKIEGV